MGQNGSSMVGKAMSDKRMLPYSEWSSKEIYAMRDRHKNELGGAFALGPSQFAMLTGLNSSTADPIFHEIFDTDHNQLVDAYEVLGTFTVLSDMPMQDKVTFVHNLYDFNGSGDITMDEMTILMRTLIVGLAKVDKKISEPAIEVLEDLTARAFAKADKDVDGEISKEEFDSYTATAPMVREFLDYWSGAVSRAAIPQGELFCDPAFPADGSSLYRDSLNPPKGSMPPVLVQWLRPSQFCPGKSVLFSEGVSAGNVRQGQLCDMWFISALAALSSRPQLLANLFVPTGQEPEGRYCVQFFKHGEWINVYVDDRIPCDAAGRPMYATGSDPNEVWPMLVEKAYAKLHGCYQNLSTGRVEEAIRDLTGGTVDKLLLESRVAVSQLEDGSLWRGLKDGAEAMLVSCSAQPKEGQMQVSALANAGLLRGNAYSVMEVKEQSGTKLLRLRNPWGAREYNGAWSDSSDLWNERPDVRQACGFTPEPDGTFWMAWEDFTAYFTSLYSCHLLDEEWRVKRREDVWPEGSGGCPNAPTWASNPQFLLSLDQPTELVLTLQQPEPRYSKGQGFGSAPLSIGFVVVEHEWGSAQRVRRLTKLKRTAVKLATTPFRRTVTVTREVSLPAGKYVVVPMTFKPNCPSKMWLSVYGNNDFTMLGGEEVKWDVGGDEDQGDENEMEGEFAEVAANDEPGADPEPSNEAVAVAALAQLIADLATQARDLLARKTKLESLLE